MRNPFNKKVPMERQPPRQPQPPKKKGCEFKTKSKNGERVIKFSPDCTAQDKEAMMKNMNATEDIE